MVFVVRWPGLGKRQGKDKRSLEEKVK